MELPEGSGWGQKMRLLAEEHAVLGHMRRQPAQHTTAMMQARVSLSLSQRAYDRAAASGGPARSIPLNYSHSDATK